MDQEFNLAYPTLLDEYQQYVVDVLMENLMKGWDECQLTAKQICWASDLIDAITVSLTGVPDGDEQERVYAEEPPMTFEAIVYYLSVRIVNSGLKDYHKKTTETNS